MPLTGVTVMALKAAAKVIPFCMLSRGRSQTSPQGPRSGAPAPGPSLRGTVPTGRQGCQLCAEGTRELLSRAVDGRWPVPGASQSAGSLCGRGPARTRGATQPPGGNGIFQNARANGPVCAATGKDAPCVPSPGPHARLCGGGATLC